MIAPKCRHRHKQTRAGWCWLCYLKLRGYSRKFYLAHRREMINRATHWNHTHVSRRRAIRRRSAKKAYMTVQGHLISTLRARINRAVTSRTRGGSLRELLGCSILFLRHWLARQFQPRMTWKNYGRRGWHIDHIKPCASFDLRKSSEQRKCFHYTNLRPLWWDENLSKGARV